MVYRRSFFLELARGCCSRGRAQTEHNDSVVGEGESPGYFFTVTDEMSANLYVTLGSHLYVYYNAGRERMLRDQFVKEAVETQPKSAFVGRRYVQPAGCG